MINMHVANDTGLSTDKLREIQNELRGMCAPNTDMFHAVKSQHGFTTIVIPQRNRR